MNWSSLVRALEKSWDGRSAFEADEWSVENPARGQCAVSSLVVQDFMGGEIVRFKVYLPDRTEKHFANLIDGEIVDITKSQYNNQVRLEVSPPDLSSWGSVREKLLTDTDTKKRYEYLRQKVAGVLAENT